MYQIGAARVEVLHPATLSDGFNNNSIVVRVVYGDVAFLMTGDAEAEAEAAMLGRRHRLSADVLKVGHHGSRTSSTAAFLQAVRPGVAIYSAGRDNPYGHPHAETLRTVAALGIPLYGTDVHGTIPSPPTAGNTRCLSKGPGARTGRGAPGRTRSHRPMTRPRPCARLLLSTSTPPRSTS